MNIPAKQEKIKVLYLTYDLGLGGTARTIQTLIKYQNNNLFTSTVCCLGGTGPREEILKKMKIKVYVTNNDLTKAENVITKFKPDIINVHFDGKGKKGLDSLLTFAKKKQIILIGTNIFAYYDPILDELFAVQLFQSKMMLNIKFKKNSKKTILPFKKYKVMYNPIDINSFKKNLLTKQEISQEKLKLGIPLNAPVIGRVGRADLAKWGDLILNAMPYIISKIPACVLLIRGLPNSRIGWIKKNNLEKNVVLLDETNKDKEILMTYQLMDIYTHTTKFGEACGNALNEAMFFKRAIITHSTPFGDNGQLEQVEHGVNGLIANHPQTFAQAVIYLLKNMNIRQGMAERGYQKVIKQFNPKLTVHYLEKLYIESLPKTKLTKQLIKWQKSGKCIPTSNELRIYSEKYSETLKKEYGSLSLMDRSKNLLYLPVQTTQRLNDQIQLLLHNV